MIQRYWHLRWKRKNQYGECHFMLQSKVNAERWKNMLEKDPDVEWIKLEDPYNPKNIKDD